MKKITILALAFVFMFVAVTPQVEAQTYYATPQFSSKEEQIAYLQGVLAQLLAAYGARYNTNYQVQYQYQSQPRVYQYQPLGYVLGARYADVAVETRYVNYSDGEATLNGYVDLKSGTDYANVWFEYGNDRDLDDQSGKKKVTRDGSFSTDVDDLEEDEYFYYRAVAQDDQGRVVYGEERAFYVGSYSRSSRNNDDEPEADTNSARDIEDDSADLRGSVDMNDFNNGYVFFVYGEDEDQVEDVDREDRYRDIDEDGDDLQKIVVDSDLDGDESYVETVRGLDDNTDHYFRLCVEYEDDDGDETLECGDVEYFETD